MSFLGYLQFCNLTSECINPQTKLPNLVEIAQMPKGVPVATVAIGNAYNAALLAIKILAVGDSSLWDRLNFLSLYLL